MKIELHIPVEQYGFVAVVVDDLGAEATAQLYREYAEAFKGGEGLTTKEYNQFIDDYLLGNMNGLGEIYARMSPKQQECAQTIKRSLARIKSKQEKGSRKFQFNADDVGPGKGEGGDWSGQD